MFHNYSGMTTSNNITKELKEFLGGETKLMI